MKTISQLDVDKMLSKIYRDALIRKSSQSFLTLHYKSIDFPESMQIALSRVLSFLPNTNYKGRPFIMSVICDKQSKEYEIVVTNPIL